MTNDVAVRVCSGQNPNVPVPRHYLRAQGQVAKPAASMGFLKNLGSLVNRQSVRFSGYSGRLLSILVLVATPDRSYPCLMTNTMLYSMLSGSQKRIAPFSTSLLPHSYSQPPLCRFIVLLVDAPVRAIWLVSLGTLVAANIAG